MDCAVNWWVNLLGLQSQESDRSYSTLSKVECLRVSVLLWRAGSAEF